MFSRIIAAVVLSTTMLIMHHVNVTADHKGCDAIRSLYQKWQEDMNHRDVNGTESFVTPDWTGVGLKGRTITKTQEDRSIARVFATTKSLNIRFTIIKCAIEGGRGTVNLRHVIIMVYRNPTNDDLTRYVQDETVLDSWVQTANGWRCNRDQVLTEVGHAVDLQRK